MNANKNHFSYKPHLTKITNGTNRKEINSAKLMKWEHKCEKKSGGFKIYQ